MFPDTDNYFGSHGSFFNFQPVSGSLEAFPPPVKPIVVQATERILNLLVDAERDQKPLSFVVVLLDVNKCSEDSFRTLKDSM